MNTVRSALLVCGALCVSGCADELVVFEKSVLTVDEMKPLLGNYELTKITGEQGKDTQFKTGKLVLERKGAGHQFSLDIEDLQNVKPSKTVKFEGSFLLSEIPDSKSKLLLFSSRRVAFSDSRTTESYENVFFILMRDEEELYAWGLIDANPIAKGKIDSNWGGYEAEEVKQFLEKYADAYAAANSACFCFKKAK